MAGDSLAPVEDLHHPRREAHLHLAAGQLIGHGVEGAVYLQVVVDVDSRPLPDGKLIGTGREGAERGRSRVS